MYKSQEACNQWLKNNIIYYHTFEWKICDLVEHAFEAGCNYILDNLEGRKIQLEESANSAGERSPDGENNKQSESLLCRYESDCHNYGERCASCSRNYRDLYWTW